MGELARNVLQKAGNIALDLWGAKLLRHLHKDEGKPIGITLCIKCQTVTECHSPTSWSHMINYEVRDLKKTGGLKVEPADD